MSSSSGREVFFQLCAATNRPKQIDTNHQRFLLPARGMMDVYFSLDWFTRYQERIYSWPVLIGLASGSRGVRVNERNDPNLSWPSPSLLWRITQISPSYLRQWDLPSKPRPLESCESGRTTARAGGSKAFLRDWACLGHAHTGGRGGIQPSPLTLYCVTAAFRHCFVCHKS